MSDVYGYVLLPIKATGVDTDQEGWQVDVGDRFRDIEVHENGIEFWGEDMGFPLKFVETLTEADALRMLGDSYV